METSNLPYTYYSPKSVIQELASTCGAIRRCIDNANSEWQSKHELTIAAMGKQYLPHGSGLDSGCRVDLKKSSDKKVVIHTSFHHMNDVGMYDGWTEHTVIVTPGFNGLNIRITGRDRNQIKEYLHEVFATALESTCRAIRSDTRVYEWVVVTLVNEDGTLKSKLSPVASLNN